jgi:hypothetical protein
MTTTDSGYHKLTPETFDTVLAVGSRVETWDGVWGTVTAIQNGDTVGTTVFERVIRLHVDHTRVYDACGWPIDGGPSDLTRLIRKYSSDLRVVSVAEGE